MEEEYIINSVLDDIILAPGAILIKRKRQTVGTVFFS